MVKESVFKSAKQKQRLGRNLRFEKSVLTTCENKKTKGKIENSHRYTTILSSLLSKFRDVFLDDLSNGLLPSREVDHLIEVVPGLKLVSKHAYRLSYSKAHEVEW